VFLNAIDKSDSVFIQWLRVILFCNIIAFSHCIFNVIVKGHSVFQYGG
jgi:hypothetical protein